MHVNGSEVGGLFYSLNVRHATKDDLVTIRARLVTEPRKRLAPDRRVEDVIGYVTSLEADGGASAIGWAEAFQALCIWGQGRR